MYSINKKEIIKLLNGELEEDEFSSLDFGICQGSLEFLSQAEIQEIIEDEGYLYDEFQEGIKLNERVLKIEIGFGYPDIDNANITNSNLDDVYEAVLCDKIDSWAKKILTYNNCFVDIADNSYCPGISYNYVSYHYKHSCIIKIIETLNIFLVEISNLEISFTKDYFLKHYLFKVDKLRWLNTNTQTRYIPILGKILKEIGQGLKPISLVKDNVLTWSYIQYQEDIAYKQHSGILHKSDSKNNVIPTSAFEQYISFLDGLGLIVKVNDFIRCTKFGLLYLELIKERIETTTDEEQLITTFFFQYWLFYHDADAIILILQAINNDYLPSNYNYGDELNLPLNTEKGLREHIEGLLKHRISSKLEFSNTIVRAVLEQRFVQSTKLELLQKQKGKKLEDSSKHSVPPRLAWLIDWDLIFLKNTEYILTEKGKIFYNNILKLPLKVEKDIIDLWLNNRFFRLQAQLNDTYWEYYDNIEEDKKDQILSELLDQAFEWQKDGALRLSYYPTLLYICFKCIIVYKTIITFNMINEKLNKPVIYNNKSYLLHLTTRLNESYISITLQ